MRFAIDTGASATVISNELAQKQQMKSTSVTDMTGAGGKIAVRVSTVESLQVGGAKVQNLAVITADFLEMLSEAVGTKLDVIIGYNYLKEFEVSIDYPNEIVSLD